MTPRLRPALAFAALLLLASACGSETPPAGPGDGASASDASDSRDAGLVRQDAAEVDGGSDAGIAADSGVVADAGLLEDSGLAADTGVLADSGVAPDAGVDADAGLSTDAGGAADAGLATDTGAAADSGGVTDAGAAADSGAVADAGAAADSGLAVDAGVAVDAAADSGVDAGLSPDSGLPSSDAGASLDAGNRCVSSQDCIPGVEICGDLRVVNNVVEPHCTTPNVGGAPVGGMCAQDGACESRLCLDGIANECGLVCGSSADCPSGFTCAGYTYNPGAVSVQICSRSCTDTAGCAATPGNNCQVQTFESAGSWHLATICQAPQGAVPLGGACSGGADCQSGLCFTNTRIGVGCAACQGAEVCGCPGGGAPPCAGGVMPDCVLRACSSVCDDVTDCAAAGQLIQCRPGVNLRLPDNTTQPISACAP